MRRKKLARLLWTLRGLRRETSHDRLLLRLGAARAKAGRAATLVDLQVPAPGRCRKKESHKARSWHRAVIQARSLNEISSLQRVLRKSKYGTLISLGILRIHVWLW